MCNQLHTMGHAGHPRFVVGLLSFWLHRIFNVDEKVSTPDRNRSYGLLIRNHAGWGGKQAECMPPACAFFTGYTLGTLGTPAHQRHLLSVRA